MLENFNRKQEAIGLLRGSLKIITLMSSEFEDKKFHVNFIACFCVSQVTN